MTLKLSRELLEAQRRVGYCHDNFKESSATGDLIDLANAQGYLLGISHALALAASEMRHEHDHRDAKEQFLRMKTHSTQAGKE